MSAWDLAQLPDEERKQLALDKAVAAVAYLERMGKPVVPEMEMRQFPQSLCPAFQARLEHYRRVSATLPGGSDPAYQKDKKTGTGQ